VVSGEAEPDTFRVTYTSDQGGSDIFSIEERVCGSKQVQYVVSGDYVVDIYWVNNF